MTPSKLVLALLLAALAGCTDPAAAKACPDSAQQFWTKFRAAVLKDDFEALAAMTHFPLKVEGDDDDSPKKFIYRKNFNKHFTTLLSYELGGDYESIRPRPASTKELVRAVVKPSECNEDGDRIYFGKLVFHLRPEGWRLATFFSNEFIVAETDEPLHVTPIESLQSAPKRK